jgi:peptide/nickel transport system permease protein
VRGGRYLILKVLQALFTMAFVITFNFFLFRVMPADPIALLTRTQGVRLSEEDRVRLIEDLGLDKPLPGQFVDYVGDLFHGELGDSLLYPGQSVVSVFTQFLWPTVLLVGVSTVLTMAIGLFMGIRGGWNRGGKGDLASMGTSLVLYSMPEFWLGMMLFTLFATILGWFPQGGYQTAGAALSGFEHVTDILNHMALPAITLTLAYLGEYYLIMRSSLLDVLGEEYITAVRAKGVRENVVLWRHAVRNAMLPTVTLVALSFAYVIGGAITVELVFSYPGVGLLTFEALQAQDFPLLEAMFLFFSLAVVVANLLSDLLYSRLDPRVKEAW